MLFRLLAGQHVDWHPDSEPLTDAQKKARMRRPEKVYTAGELVESDLDLVALFGAQKFQYVEQPPRYSPQELMTHHPSGAFPGGQVSAGFQAATGMPGGTMSGPVGMHGGPANASGPLGYPPAEMQSTGGPSYVSGPVPRRENPSLSPQDQADQHRQQYAAVPPSHTPAASGANAGADEDMPKSLQAHQAHTHQAQHEAQAHQTQAPQRPKGWPAGAPAPRSEKEYHQALNQMTVAELRAHAEAERIDLKGAKTKEDIVKAIKD